MTIKRAKWLCTTLSLSAALLLVGRAQADNFETFKISVNTSGVLLGTTGYLDLQLDPGFIGSTDAASATITGFVTDGSLTAALPNIGDVTGSLPGTVTINNTDVTNEYTQGFTFGSFVDVFVTLDSPVISGTASGGNSFTLDVEDSGFNSLLGSFPAVEIDLDATTGAPMVTNNSGGAATVTTVAEVPEPVSILLLATCLIGLTAACRKIH
jgi:hypothetical protein